MKLGGLLAALVVCAGLFGVVYWSNNHKKDDAPKADLEAPPKILTISEADIQKVEIRRKNGDDTVLDRAQGGKWRITAPKEFGADQETVTSLLTTVSDLASDRLVDDKTTDLAQYGLAAPAVDVTLTRKNGKTKRLWIGDDAPTGGSSFAKLEDDPRVFTIASFNKTNLDKTVKDLRDKRLLTFDSDKLSRLELKAKKQDIEFGRVNQNEWQIVKPKPLRADGLQVEELLRKLKDAKMDLAVPDVDAKKAAAAFASATPVATARTTDPSGARELEVRKTKTGDYYAKSSAVEGVYKVGSELGTGLDKSVDDFRNKKLFDFGFNDPAKIEMHDGPKTYLFTKSGENWLAAGKTMDTLSFQSYLDKLRDLSATKFVDSGSSAPGMDITVTSDAGKRVEKVLFSKAGAAYVARRENELSFYELDAKTVEDLEKAASDVKPAQDKSKKK